SPLGAAARPRPARRLAAGQGLEAARESQGRVTRIHARIANRRKDFLHKLTTDLVDRHDGICIEDLGLKGLTRTKLSKSFHDASMGEFRRQVGYKCEWNRKHLGVIDR